MVNKPDCIELGLTCTNAYKPLAGGVSGGRADQPSEPPLEVINQLRRKLGLRHMRRPIYSLRFQSQDRDRDPQAHL